MLCPTCVRRNLAPEAGGNAGIDKMIFICMRLFNKLKPIRVIIYRIISIFFIAVFVCLKVFSQTEGLAQNLLKDYLSDKFHAGRRQALRDLMPPNSVTVIFAYPIEVFSNDVDYVYHPNPDMYYFSGYKEPDAMLLIFKEEQADDEGRYNELFFVRHRDPKDEQFTGKRLGVEGVKTSLGFQRVYNGEDFEKFPLDLKKFMIITDMLPDTSGFFVPGSLKQLVSSLVVKGSIKPVDKNLALDLSLICNSANAKNLASILAYMKPRLNTDAYKNDSLISALVATPDSVTLMEVRKKCRALNIRPIIYNQNTNALRGIKTPEELVLLKKSVSISSIAHTEAMRAVRPGMSERELEGIMIYIHKKYGAEDEGYPPIVGAGANGCILHYEENDLTKLGNQLVLMDVGSMYHGYSADVTRTFPANGKFTNEQKAIYQIVYEAQEEVFHLCKDGISFDSLESKATRVLASGLMKLGLIKEAAQVKTYYPHGMSHHLGLDVHDNGNYGLLQENMVITVEPGIYIPAGSACDKKWWNIGVRIEDDVLIGKNSCTILSAYAPRKWQDIEKTIAEKSVFDAAKFPELK
jgi:Xaa-Pro aminopeptidase